MKALELTPLKDKRLQVYLVEKEYNEPFWLIEPHANGTPSKSLRRLFSPSIAFCNFLEKLIDKVHPAFISEELGMRSSREFEEDNPLSQLLMAKNVKYLPVDIDENAQGYIAAKIKEKIETRNQILDTLNKIPKKSKENVEKDYLIAYGQCLQREIEEEQHEASFAVRENWIVMGILDQARKLKDEEKITCIHITSPQHAKNIKNLLESLDADVETIKLLKEVISSQPMGTDSKGLAGSLQSMQISAKPIIKKSADGSPHILFYLDTDQRASSFDICMAYDAGFKAVVPYENVSIEDARKVTQDAMFSRGPKGIKHTCFFIGGKDMEKAEKILETVKNTMFPPFETGIIADPGGAYTTAAAAVAKIEEALLSSKLGNLRDKTCAIFGTGPVGKIIAVLLTRLGCESIIVSINPNRTNGKEYAENISKALKSKYGVNVEGAFAPNAKEKLKILTKADVIFCASTEGVQVIEKKLLENLKLLKVMADINAVPPLGVEGINQQDDMKEITPGIFGIGALTIGKLKYELEKKILKEATKNSEEIYNYKIALQLARKLLRNDKEMGKAIGKLTVTLKYPEK